MHHTLPPALPMHSSLPTPALQDTRCRLPTALLTLSVSPCLSGYTCTIVEEGTFTKTTDPDPEWSLGPQGAASGGPSEGADVYLRAKKAAGGRLAAGYLEAAGVRIVPS